ncbi:MULTISPECIES: TonB-dependent receptor [Sphingobacterium]|uniref:TonB-dependent receptor n=1 Tax=Sphingobacterium TaxID=28453 RepID=UPI00257B77BA|nr:MULTISPECIES: TonB-dependent receptor [Sphingobacterium]
MNILKILTYFFSVFLLCISLICNAQQHKSVKGRVVDQQGVGIQYINVEVIKKDFEIPKASTLTDNKGYFSLTVESIEDVSIRIRGLGYRDTILQRLDVINSDSSILKDIILKPSIEQLEIVDVIGRRPQVSLKGDRISLNVSQNITSTGSSVLEVLSRSPGVYVTSDDDIMLNSKSNVLVAINGRQTYMSGKELANYLRSLPAQNVKSIELISNPPANYDAAGTGGVIDIILANNNIQGLHGSVTGGATYNSKLGYSTAANLNYMTSKFQSKFDVSHNNIFYGIDLNVDRNFSGATVNESELFSQNTQWDMRGKLTQATAAINYSFNDDHRIGTSYQLYYLDKKDMRIGDTKIYTGNSFEPSDIVNTSANEKSPQNRHAFDVFYLGKLDTIGSSLDANISYVISNRDFLSTLISSGSVPAEPTSNLHVLTDNPIEYNILAGQIDYTKVFGSGLKIISGLKYSTVKSDNNLMIRNFIDGAWKDDPKSSNHFKYKEKIGAAYLSLNAPIGKSLQIDAGTRVEHTQMHGKSLTTGEENDRSYLDFFPSISVTNTFNQKHKMTLNYNRRITRPNYELLNPFVRYLDPFTIQTGYPGIRPMYSNGIELSNTFNDKYQIALFYNNLSDVFNVILNQNDETKITTVQTLNLDSQNEWGIRSNVGIKFFKWWDSNNSFIFNKVQYKSKIDGSILDVKQHSYNLRTQHDMEIFKGIKLQMTGSFIGPVRFGQFKQDPQQWLDMGLQKSFLDGRLQVNIKATDVFKSQNFFANIDFANIKTVNREYYSNQSIGFTLKYTFKKGKDFQVNEKEGATEEKGRMN